MTTPHAPSTAQPQRRVKVTGHEQLPQLAEQIRGHGARPGDLVYLGMASGKLEMSLSYNIFDVELAEASLAVTALDAARALAKRRCAAIVLAYGDLATIQAAADVALSALDTGFQVPVQAAYHIHNGRMHCLICQDCMPGGTAVATQPIAHLDPAPHADRAAVAARYDHPEDPQMTAAVTAAISRYARSFAHVSGPDELDDEVHAAGQAAVSEALAIQADSRTITNAQAAWLMLLLNHNQVCRHVWEHAIDSDTCFQLWAGLLGRTPDRLAAPVAAALALSSLLRGDGLTANIAIERAERTDPGYPPLRLLQTIQRLALSPAEVRSALAGVLGRPTAADSSATR